MWLPTTNAEGWIDESFDFGRRFLSCYLAIRRMLTVDIKEIFNGGLRRLEAMRKYKDSKETKAVLKRALHLAWKACGGTMGMGFFMDEGPDKTEDEVWERVHGPGDYCISLSRQGSLYADYVFGRMMKLSVQYGLDYIHVPDVPVRSDYQSWCIEYPSYGALFNAAECSLGIKSE